MLKECALLVASVCFDTVPVAKCALEAPEPVIDGRGFYSGVQYCKEERTSEEEIEAKVKAVMEEYKQERLRLLRD